jgi:hypothetical protein
LGRIEIGEASLRAGLRASNHWSSIAAEFFEDAAPITPMGKLDHAFFGERLAASNPA